MKRNSYLKTNVILDTEVYEANGYNYNTTSFCKLLEFIEKGIIQLYQTSIIEREIIHHINFKADTYFKKIKSTIGESRILSNLAEYQKISTDVFLDEIKAQLFDSYENFKKTNIINIPDPKKIDIHNIFDAYFEAKPPFDTSKKKHEFPDAMSLIFTYNHFKSKHKSAIYISNDSDIPKLIACLNLSKHIKCEKSINELLDKLIIADKQKAYLKKLAYENHDKILEQLNEKFYDIGLFPLGYDADIIEGEITNLDINNIFFSEVDDHYALASIEADIEFQAIIDFDDPDFTYYDSEDKREYCFERRKAKYLFSSPIEAQIEFIINDNKEWELEVFPIKETITFEFNPYEDTIDDI